MYECRIKQNRAVNQIQYKSNTITKEWQRFPVDYSTTNSLIECRLAERNKLQEPVEKPLRKMNKTELLEKAAQLGINTKEIEDKTKEGIIEEIEIVGEV